MDTISDNTSGGMFGWPQRRRKIYYAKAHICLIPLEISWFWEYDR